MKSLHIGTKFYVEEYEEHGRNKRGPDAQTKKDIWWPRCQAVIRYLNSNDGHSIFGECGKPERRKMGAKEDCVSHLADALMRFKKKTNKYRIIIKQKLSANEVIKSRFEDEPVDESEVATKTPPSYFNPKPKDLPAKRGPLATGSEEHNKRDPFGGFEGERGSLFDMSDYINLSPERELSLMQLEGPPDVVNNGINDNEKEEPRPKVFDPTNIKVMFQVYGEKGSIRACVPSKDGVFVQKSEAQQVAQRLLQSVGSILLSRKGYTVPKVREILFEDTETGDLDFDSPGKVPLDAKTVLKAFIILHDPEGQPNENGTVRKSSMKRTELRARPSQSQSSRESSRDRGDGITSEADDMDDEHEELEGPPDTSISSSSDDDDDDDDALSCISLKPSSRDDIDDSGTDSGDEDFDPRMVNSLKRMAAKMKSNGHFSTHHHDRKNAEAGMAFWRITDDTRILNPNKGERLSDDKAMERLRREKPSRPQTVDTYKYCKGIVVLDFFFKSDPIISKTYISLKRKPKEWRSLAGGCAALAEHFKSAFDAIEMPSEIPFPKSINHFDFIHRNLLYVKVKRDKFVLKPAPYFTYKK
ncbi:hypothetical protein BC829DRAFT_418165 [Chytridium lagenaria]|nr:hypothetical protein BC829DRAFT_418165 [Chytridium lagenaria]